MTAQVSTYVKQFVREQSPPPCALSKIEIIPHIMKLYKVSFFLAHRRQIVLAISDAGGGHTGNAVLSSSILHKEKILLEPS